MISDAEMEEILMSKMIQFRTSLAAIVLVTLSILIFGVAMTPAARGDNDVACFSICKYEDANNAVYMGMTGSSGGCTIACRIAQHNCETQSKVGGCRQVGACTSAGCG